MFWRMLFRECKDVAKIVFFLQTGLFLRVGVLRPCMVVRSCLSLSLSLARSNHLGLLHLQSAGGLSFAIRAVTSPTPQQIKVPATS